MFQSINSPNTIFWSSLCFPESTVTFLCFEMSTNLKGFIGILIFLSLVFKNVITSLLTPLYRSSTTTNKMSTPLRVGKTRVKSKKNRHITGWSPLSENMEKQEKMQNNLYKNFGGNFIIYRRISKQIQISVQVDWKKKRLFVEKKTYTT